MKTMKSFGAILALSGCLLIIGVVWLCFNGSTPPATGSEIAGSKRTFLNYSTPTPSESEAKVSIKKNYSANCPMVAKWTFTP